MLNSFSDTQKTCASSLAAVLVSLIVTVVYKHSILHDTPPNYNHVDYLWHLLIGIGCVPGVIALYFRLTIPETPRFTMDVERNIQQASADISNVLASEKSSKNTDAII